VGVFVWVLGAGFLVLPLALALDVSNPSVGFRFTNQTADPSQSSLAPVGAPQALPASVGNSSSAGNSFSNAYAWPRMASVSHT
jgi:hypothetical protein